MGEMAGSVNVIADFFRGLASIGHVITHPIIIWNWLMNMAYWIVSIGTCVCIIIHTATKIQRVAKLFWLLIVVYILLKGVDLAI